MMSSTLNNTYLKGLIPKVKSKLLWYVLIFLTIVVFLFVFGQLLFSNPFLLIALIFSMALTLLSPYHLLFVYILALQFNDRMIPPLGELGELTIRYIDFVILALLIRFGVKKISQGKWIIKSSINKPMLFFFAALLLSVANTYFANRSLFLGSLIAGLKLIEYAVLYIIVAEELSTKSRVKSIVNFILALGTVQGIFSIYSYIIFSGAIGQENRIPTGYGSLGQSGIVFSMLLLIQFGLMGNQHALKVTIWQIIKLPLLFIGLLFTFARAPLIAFVLLFAIMCIKKRALGIYVLSVAIIAFSIIFHHFATSYRLRELTPENFGISALSHRILLWIAGYQIFLDYPIIGVGWQNFPFYSREYADIVLRKAGPLQTFTTYSLYGVIFQDTSHSIYNDILSGTGIVGIIAAIILFSYLFRLLRNSYRSGTDKYLSSLSYGIFFGITSVFMSFLAYSPGGDPASGIMWIFIGISIACGNIMKRQHVVSKYTAATIINGNEEK